MHDSLLTELKIKKRHLSNRTCIDIETQWDKYGNKFFLAFKDVKRYNINVDISNGYSEFGDYVIGEFTAVDENNLSFEFIFFNNSIIHIIFRKLVYNKLV